MPFSRNPYERHRLKQKHDHSSEPAHVVSKAGANETGKRRRINLLDTSTVTFTLADDSQAQEIDVSAAVVTSALDFGEAGDISTIEPDDAATAGTTGEIADAGHQHAIVTVAPTGNIDIGDAASEGVATTFPRSDHQHQFSAPGAGYPVNADAGAEADGTATTPARSDHKHTVTTAAPTVVLGTAGAAGVSSSLVRADATITAFDATVPSTIQPDDAAAVGSAGVAARRDHKHAIVAAAPGSILPDTGAAGGVATSFARSDHAHGIATDAPVRLGTVNTEGVSTSFARADHKHQLANGAIVSTQQTTTSAAYTDLATSGPAVTIKTGTSAIVIVTALVANDTANETSLMSVAVSGATIIAAADSRALSHVGSANTGIRASRMTLFITNLTAGSNTFTAKYRVTTGTGIFGDREIMVIPITVP